MSAVLAPASASPLAGLTAIAGQDAPGAVAAAHLTALGARVQPGAAGELSVIDGPHCDLRADPALPAAEPIVQAVSGLMAVHGRDRGRPRRLAVDIASRAAGILATQAILAALLARSRGLALASARTSALDGALLFVAHHLAIATGDDPLWPARNGLAGAGPPFPTADGSWVELEALTPQAWVGFWSRLGVAHDIAGASWSPFVLRYLAGTCALPPALHEASARRRLAELRAAAAASDVALCPLRRAPSGPRSNGAPWRLTAADAPGRLLAPVPPGAAGPLDGLRVVELATRLQGPLAGQLLRQLGADVVKVEPPGGDMGRAARAGFGYAAYLAYNRGKRVVEIDYKSAPGRAELQELAADADVFLHNSPPGRAERLGYGYAELTRRNPALVHAHASGWGPADGPTRIAGDFIVQAHSGLGESLNPAGERPFPSRVTVLDVTGGLIAGEAILAALCQRGRSGRGCRVETSLLAAADVLRRDGPAPRFGPLDEPLKTPDGLLVVALADAAARRRLAAACGLEGADEEQLAQCLCTRAAADWARELPLAGVPAAIACAELADLGTDPLVAARLEQIESGCLVPSAPWRFSAG